MELVAGGVEEGDILAVASTLCYAFYLVILEGPTKTYRPVNMLRWVFLLCPTFLAYFLVQPAEKLIGSERVSLYQNLLPVFATISAVVIGLDHLK